MEPSERSNLQLISILGRNEGKDEIDSFLYTSKTHSTLGEKNLFLSMLKIAGWLVTHIYEHYTFPQSKFKKDFVIMN